MVLSIVYLAALVSAAGSDETVAESVTLKDGRAVLGIVESDRPRGPVTMIVRRKWAAAAVPDLLARWEAAEKPEATRARKERRERLEDWKKDRLGVRQPSDRILAWIDRELEKPEPQADSPSRLMVVTIERDLVQAIVRKPEDTTRLLRAGWLAEFDGPEEMSPTSLSESLSFRGIDPVRKVPIDALLPVGTETTERWQVRRAATEAANDPWTRFIEVGGLLMPDPSAARNGGMAAMMALPPRPASGREPSIESLLRQRAGGPGRVGAIVTRQKPSRHGDAMTSESTLWVRNAEGALKPAVSDASTVKVADLTEDDLKAPARGRQAFVMRQFEVKNVNGRIVRRERKIGDDPGRLGIAGQKASAQVKNLMDAELAGLAFELD